MSKMAYDELIDTLISLNSRNFTRLQAAAYIAILQMGEETGSAIARESGINRSKIYDILGQLEHLGAIEQVSREGKIRYKAVSPGEVFSKIEREFIVEINKSRDLLEQIKDVNKDIEPAVITLTTLFLKDLDINEFEYLITSNQKSRTSFVERIPKEFRPSPQVKILDLNHETDTLGLILLISGQQSYVFNTPLGNTVEAMKITNPNINKFLTGIIQDDWKNDIPLNYKEKILQSEILALVTGKSMYMRNLKDGVETAAYDRPVSFLITDELIIFFYEGLEEPRIPIQFINDVSLEGDNTIRITTRFKSGSTGELRMRTVDNPVYLANLLKTLSPMI